MEPKTVCETCRTALVVDAKFCHNCGLRIIRSDAGNNRHGDFKGFLIDESSDAEMSETAAERSNSQAIPFEYKDLVANRPKSPLTHDNFRHRYQPIRPNELPNHQQHHQQNHHHHRNHNRHHHTHERNQRQRERSAENRFLQTNRPQPRRRSRSQQRRANNRFGRKANNYGKRGCRNNNNNYHHNNRQNYNHHHRQPTEQIPADEENRYGIPARSQITELPKTRSQLSTLEAAGLTRAERIQILKEKRRLSRERSRISSCGSQQALPQESSVPASETLANPPEPILADVISNQKPNIGGTDVIKVENVDIRHPNPLPVQRAKSMNRRVFETAADQPIHDPVTEEEFCRLADRFFGPRSQLELNQPKSPSPTTATNAKPNNNNDSAPINRFKPNPSSFFNPNDKPSRPKDGRALPVRIFDKPRGVDGSNKYRRNRRRSPIKNSKTAPKPPGHVSGNCRFY